MVHTYSADEAWWSKGHGTLIDDADGNWYVVYHAYRNGFHTLGRSTIIESVEWSEDGWPVLTEKDGAKWEQGGLQGDYSYLRDVQNPLLWSKWQPGYFDGTLWLTTAVDESYEITATFETTEKNSAGLFLFYNEQANSGDLTGGTQRIRNERNIVSIWRLGEDGEWELIKEGLDLSSWHHNNYNGFFALRPGYWLKGDAKLVSFEYKPL